MITQIRIRKPDDFHVHLREADLLREVLPWTARNFARALVMPNLQKPITIGTNARFYEEEIRRICDELQLPFTPLMTIKLTQGTTKTTIESAASCQVRAVKLYPEGVTTNSDNGVRHIEAISDDVFSAMIDSNMVLCVHAEEPGAFSMVREQAYLPHIKRLLDKFPRLKIVIEHASSAEAVQFVEEGPANIAATITVHHLLMTLDDVIDDSGKLNPHNFCKPIAKGPEDKKALLVAALSGNPKFFLGTDSAPHVKETKESASGCAGCFTAPTAIELLTTIFDEQGSLTELEAFTSENGAIFYGLPLNEGTLTLDRSNWVVKQVGSVVPFKMGQTVAWHVSDRDP